MHAETIEHVQGDPRRAGYFSLLLANLVQIHIAVSLESSLPIPVCLPVSPQHETITVHSSAVTSARFSCG